MKITLTFNTDNAAFDDEEGGNFEYEVNRVMKKAADLVCVMTAEAILWPTKTYTRGVRDINGNTVGTVTVEPGE